MSLSRLARIIPSVRSIRSLPTRTLATVAAADPSQTQQQQGQTQSQSQQQSGDVSVARNEDRGMTRRRDRGDLFSELERDMNQMMHSFATPFGSLAAWSPFRHLSPFADNWGLSRRRMMDFDQLLNRTVNINLEEKEQEYVMTIQAPGLKKEELNINVDNDMLTISGSHEERHEGRRGSTTTEVSFHRSMALPVDINQDGIKAEYDDKGNLCRVHLPKVPEIERKQRGKIEIESTPSS